MRLLETFWVDGLVRRWNSAGNGADAMRTVGRRAHGDVAVATIGARDGRQKWGGSGGL